MKYSKSFLESPLDKSKNLCYTIGRKRRTRIPFSPYDPDADTVYQIVSPPLRWDLFVRSLWTAAHFFVSLWRCFPIKPTNEKEHLINDEIISASFPRSKQVRVIGAENEQLGILSLANALNAAYEKELDLVLIAPTSEPPVCRIMDYGKYCFDRDKKKKEAKKKQQRVDVKEIQLKCQIEQNDFNTKVNNARRFLTSGDKVKVMVVFRGRQMAYQDVGRSLLEKFSAAVADLGTIDKAPVLEGRSMTMFISPAKQTASK